MTCPHCHEQLGDLDIIGVEVPRVYDGMLFWQCLKCEGAIHRFPVGHWLYARAADYGRITGRRMLPAASSR